MNKEQAEMVVALATQGFHREALSLVEQGRADTVDLESREVLASSDALQHLKAMLYKVLTPFASEGVLGKILNGIAQRMFSIKLTAAAIKSILVKITLILLSVIGVIAPILLYMLVQKVEEHAKQTNWMPRNRSYNPQKQKEVYSTMVEDNLRDLKQKVRQVMSN